MDRTGANEGRSGDLAAVQDRARNVLSAYLALPDADRASWQKQFGGLDISKLREQLGV